MTLSILGILFKVLNFFVPVSVQIPNRTFFGSDVTETQLVTSTKKTKTTKLWIPFPPLTGF